MEGNHGEKRPAEQHISLLEGVRAVLVDVEGVTTPLAFVKEVLVPYVKANLKTFLEGNFDNEQVQASINSLRTKAIEDKEAGVDGVKIVPTKDAAKDAVVEAVTANVIPKLDGNLEGDALRSLLEQVWEDGYKAERIHGEVYDDVAPLFQMLVSEGVKIYSYSSDSKKAQILLFSFSSQGDILGLLSGHFEAPAGEKSKGTFSSLAEAMERPSSEILYLCHCPADARVANSAGFKTVAVIRDTSDPSSSTPDEPNDCNVIYSLDELWDEYSSHEPSVKRLHADYYGEFSTDGATNDSEVVTGEEGADEPYGHAYGESPEGAGEEENGDSQDA